MGWLERHHTGVTRTATGIVCVATLGIAGFGSAEIRQLSMLNDQQAKTIRQLSDGLDGARHQLQSKGVTPTVPSASQIRQQTQPSAKASASSSPVVVAPLPSSVAQGPAPGLTQAPSPRTSSTPPHGGSSGPSGSLTSTPSSTPVKPSHSPSQGPSASASPTGLLGTLVSPIVDPLLHPKPSPEKSPSQGPLVGLYLLAMPRRNH